MCTDICVRSTWPSQNRQRVIADAGAVAAKPAALVVVAAATAAAAAAAAGSVLASRCNGSARATSDAVAQRVARPGPVW